MSTMTNRLACRPCWSAAAPVGACNVEPADTILVLARKSVCAMAFSDGMTGIGGTRETGRAFPAGDDT
ncbi:MAG: hypothetical protein M3R31_02605 [Pseudomonadota bacterium]|nr:hypothetical protein [Pseudomonadota bacterium]